MVGASFFFFNSNFILFWQSSYGSSPIRACLQHSCINTLFKETQSKFWYLFVHKQNSLPIKSWWRKKNWVGSQHNYEWVGRHLQTILNFRPWDFWTFIQLDDEQLILCPIHKWTLKSRVVNITFPPSFNIRQMPTNVRIM